MTLLERLVPRRVDNQYRGQPLARWWLLLITACSLIRALLHILLPDGGAGVIATLPLSAYSSQAAASIVGLFAYWGLSQLLLALLSALVLWRYQSLIPLMCLVTWLEWSGRWLLGQLKPIATVGTAPGAVANQLLPLLGLVMLVLALRPSRPGRQRPLGS